MTQSNKAKKKTGARTLGSHVVLPLRERERERGRQREAVFKNFPTTDVLTFRRAGEGEKESDWGRECVA
jgi:hypothetical protein